MRKLVVRSILGIVVVAPQAFAQISGDSCVRLAETVATGYSETFSDHQFEAAKYYASCEVAQSNRSGGLNLAYSGFSLGMQADEAKRKEYCSKSFENYGVKTTEYNRTKKLFSEALDTINACLNAAAKGWDIRYEQVAKDSVSLNISNGGPEGGRLLGVDVLPKDSLVCAPPLPTTSVLVTSTKPIAATCSRTPTTQMVDGVAVTSAPEAVLNLRLIDRPFPIKMLAYQSSALGELNRKIDSVRNDTGVEIDGLRSNLGKWPIGSESAQVSSCADGQYATGVKYEMAPGGAHGYVFRVYVVCRPLNAKK